jgi:TBC1 domain family member 14
MLSLTVYFNFKQHHISPAAYLPDWLIPLFLDHLPFEACARLWDVLLLEGDAFLYRAALGVLAVLEPRLFFPDRRELLELLMYVSPNPLPDDRDSTFKPGTGEKTKQR